MMSLYDNKPTSLCSLFWAQVWTFFLALALMPFFCVGAWPHKKGMWNEGKFNYFTAGGVGAVITVFIAVVLGIIAVLFLPFYYSKSNEDYSSMMIVRGFVWFCLLTLLGAKFLEDKTLSFPLKNTLLVKYLKAKKEKVCPIIEWEK